MMKTISAIIVVFVAALSINIPSSEVHMLGCEGDSQTAPRFPVAQNETYCARTATRLGWNYHIFARSGSTSQDVINRLPADLATPGCCDCFLVQIGANDSFIDPNTPLVPEWSGPLVPLSPGITVAQFSANLTTIANTVRAANVPIVFLTQWAFFASPEIVQEQFYVDAMKDTAAQIVPPVPIVDMFSLQLGGLWWNYRDYKSLFWSIYETDYQHPSAAGHALEAAQFTKPRYASSCAFHP